MGTGKRKGGKLLEPFVKEEGRMGTKFWGDWVSLRGAMLVSVNDRDEGRNNAISRRQLDECVADYLADPSVHSRIKIQGVTHQTSQFTSRAPI